MADKPFIAARLRNPAEEQPAAKAKTPSKVDWIGGAAALVAIVLAGITLGILYAEYSEVGQYFTSIGLPF